MATKILDTVHETAKGLHKSGAMSTKTMREFDALCLSPVKNLSAALLLRPDWLDLVVSVVPAAAGSVLICQTGKRKIAQRQATKYKRRSFIVVAPSRQLSS